MALPQYEAVRFDSLEEGEGQLVRRFDVGELSAPERTPDGFLRAQGITTRAGVFEYRRADGSTFKELRAPEEVFSPEAMRSLALLPITNDHPPDNLTPETVRKYQVGQTGHPERVGDAVRSDILLTDAKAIADAEAGKTGLSYGYRTHVYAVPGTWRDSAGREHRFDTYQTNIRGNHLAQTHAPRAGEGARMRMDSADAEQADEPADKTDPSVEKTDAPQSKSGPKRRKDSKERTVDEVEIQLNGQTFKVSKDVAAAMEASKAEAGKAASRADGDSGKREADELRGKLAAAEAQLAERKDAEQKKSKKEQEDQVVTEKLEICGRAAPLLGKPMKDLVKMDSIDIMREVVKQESPSISLDGESDAFVRGIFMQVTSRVDTAAEIAKSIGAGKDHAQKHSQRSDSDAQKQADEAHAAMLARDRDAWKPKANA